MTDLDLEARAQHKLMTYRLEAERARQRAGRDWRLRAAQVLRDFAARLEADPTARPSHP